MANDYSALGEGVGGLPGLELILEVAPPLDPVLALKDTARRALAQYFPSWRKRDLDSAIFDFQVRELLPCVTDTSYRAKEDPSQALLINAAYQVLTEEGFEAVSGRWYVPDPTKR